MTDHSTFSSGLVIAALRVFRSGLTTLMHKDYFGVMTVNISDCLTCSILLSKETNTMHFTFLFCLYCLCSVHAANKSFSEIV